MRLQNVSACGTYSYGNNLLADAAHTVRQKCDYANFICNALLSYMAHTVKIISIHGEYGNKLVA